MMRRIVVLAGVALTLAALAAPEAAARPRDGTVAVLSLEITGDGDPQLRPQLQKSLRGGLAAGGLRVVDMDAVMKALADTPELIGCTSTTCLSRIGAKTGADYFVRTTVEANGSAYKIALELLSPRVEGALVTRVERQCPVCTIMEVNDVVSAAAKDMVELPPAQPVPVLINTDPEGARVFINGRDAGTSPHRDKLEPGEHEIAAERPGHARAQSRITVSADAASEPQTYELTLAPATALDPAAPPVDQGAPGRPFRVWKWAAAGGAAAALIAGISMIAIDGSDGCDLPQGQRQCPEVWDTQAAGVAFIVAGVGLGGASGWMFYRDIQDKRDATLTVVPTGGGAFAGVRVRF